MTAAEYKTLRERLGTQAEVAARLQVSRVTVARRETGAMKITEEAALALLALQLFDPSQKEKKAMTTNIETAPRIHLEEASQHVWDSDISCQLGGWMLSASEHNEAVKKQMESFLAALTPEEVTRLRNRPLHRRLRG